MAYDLKGKFAVVTGGGSGAVDRLLFSLPAQCGVSPPPFPYHGGG